jgi:uncharacterized membrane protein YesL
MIGFLIKKVFFDIWDNLLMLVLQSLGFVAPLGLFFLSGYIGDANPVVSVIILVLAVLAFSMYSLGINAVVFGYSSYRKGGIRAFKDAFRFHIGHAFLHFGICIVIAFMILYGIPFYFSMSNYFGLIIGFMIFWILVATVLAMQYFFPLCFHMEGDGAFKTLKKCFLVVPDNLGTTLFLALRSVIDLALTALTASMIPGLAGIALSRMDTTRLLMKKYDFLEANPDCKRKDINWEDLLYEERKLVGPRSLKGMIFPWKD